MTNLSALFRLALGRSWATCRSRVSRRVASSRGEARDDRRHRGRRPHELGGHELGGN